MTTHPGMTITIYDIPNIVSKALSTFCYSSNLTLQQRHIPGFWILVAYVTDRPLEYKKLQMFEVPQQQPPTYLNYKMDGDGKPQIEKIKTHLKVFQLLSLEVKINHDHLLLVKNASTLEVLRQLHKTGPRKRSGINRKKHSSSILTDS